MSSARMAEILSLMKPDEVQDAMWLIDVFERQNMRPDEADEADEWRRRILAQQRFLDLKGESRPAH